MKKLNLMVAGAVGALLAGTAAWAGYKSTYYVGVDTTSREAYGSFGSARASADSVQYIGCAVQGFSNGTNYVLCQARNANNVSAYCSSSEPALVNAATALSDGSYMYLNWDANGTCTYLYVSNASQWAPRQP